MKTTPYLIQISRIPSFIIYSFKALGRLATGRWHIFRDMPDWYVQILAHENEDVEFSSEEIQNFLELSSEEWNLRKRKRNTNRKAN